MNNKIKKIVVIFFTFLFAIFLSNIFIKEINSNKSDITNMKILNYIPTNYEFTILSNATTNNIKKFINENTSKKKREELNMIKDAIISYLGFDLQEELKDIYDNELAITFFGNTLNKKDILLVFKLKKNKDISNIINNGEEFNKSNNIIELKRLKKLNYISHIYITDDNYLIASSNKRLINNSLQANKGDEILSKNLIPDDINLEEIKLLSISKYRNQISEVSTEPTIIKKLITIINSENNKIKLRTFSPNIKKIDNKIDYNKIDNIKNIIYTNKYSIYKQNIDFLYNDIKQKEFLEEIFEEVNKELLFITNNNNWVLCFRNKLPDKFSIEEINFLTGYKKEDFDINNISYSIYTNDRLKIKDNNIIYERKNPIFSLEDDGNTYVSNNFNFLLSINQETSLIDQYLNNKNEIDRYTYILKDIFYIKSINNKQFLELYKSLKNLSYFINTQLFSLEDININISQTVPERHEKIYLESNLKIL
tara:strand:- start:5 stop:1447 length:1443 start_codon:yes stop_codon:yes gene_type:complete